MYTLVALHTWVNYSFHTGCKDTLEKEVQKRIKNPHLPAPQTTPEVSQELLQASKKKRVEGARGKKLADKSKVAEHAKAWIQSYTDAQCSKCAELSSELRKCRSDYCNDTEYLEGELDKLKENNLILLEELEKEELEILKRREKWIFVC